MIERFHYITQDNIEGKSSTSLAEAACIGGAKWVQVRTKVGTDKEKIEIASSIQQICKTYQAKLIINDHVEIAKMIGADGVHLGQSDMNIEDARYFLGSHFIIGGTITSVDDAIRCQKAGADYLGLGPYHYTSTKKNTSKVLGVEGINQFMKDYQDSTQSEGSQHLIPIIAIGGIQLKDIGALLKTGIHGVAIASAINRTKNKEMMVENMIAEIQKKTLEYA